jgi:esterase
VKLASQEYGGGDDRPPLLIAHGLFGSARNWGVVAKRLAETRRAVAVDMRNHGDSPWADVHDYPAMADDLAEAIDGTWDVLGHSMGGKAAMVLALTHPGKVNRLVVADIAPVPYGHTQAHLVEAMAALDLSAIASRADADRALSASVEDAGVRAFLLQSLDLRERRWRLNLDVLGREMPKILSFPEITDRFEGPTLFLSGANSSYVLPEHRDRIKALFPAARFAKIPDAGHWLHAERPREFEAAVAAFLD